MDIWYSHLNLENQQFNDLQAHRLFEGAETILINELALCRDTIT